MGNNYEILVTYGLGASLLLGGGNLFLNDVNNNYERLKEEKQLEKIVNLNKNSKKNIILNTMDIENSKPLNVTIIEKNDFELTPLPLNFRIPPNDKSFYSQDYSLEFLLKSSNAKLRKGAKYFKSQNCGYKTNCLDKLVELSIKNKYNPEFVFALIGGETGYDCNQFSHAGAAGCFQFMPKTARKYKLKVPRYRTKNPRRDERFNVNKSMNAWFDFMNDMRKHRRVNSEKRIVAVHNGGSKALRNSKSCRGKLWYECLRNRGYGETRRLVKNTNFYMREIKKDKKRIGFKQKIKTKFS